MLNPLPPQPVRVAVVGCGYWGRNLVRNFAALNALAAVVDASASVAHAISDAYGVPARALGDVLDDRTIDALVIATPAASHAQLAADAMSAGKDVYVEKPLALRIADAKELCAQADSRGRILMVGHLLQYHPAFGRLQELVQDGSIGRLQYIYSNRLNLGRIRREEDILWSFAPHDISMILSLVRASPKSVLTVGARYLHNEISDVTTTHLAFPGGEQAHVFVSWLHPFKEQKLIVVGDGGMLVFDDANPWDSKLTVFDHRINWREGAPRVIKAEGRPVPVEDAEPLALECSHFLECVVSRTRPRTDGEEGLRVLEVLSAASASMAAGHSVPCESVADGAASKSARPRDRSRSSEQGYFVHETAYVDERVTIGSGAKIWHFSHVLPDSEIGAGCILGQNVVLGPAVKIGDNCKIQNNVSLYEGVTLEDGVFCGPSCVFTNVINPRAEVPRRDQIRPTMVRRGATIGANATIVCGNTVGSYALVAAGAVVTSDVPAHALMVGVPARRVGWVSHAGEILGKDLVCPLSHRKYIEVGPHELREISD